MLPKAIHVVSNPTIQVFNIISCNLSSLATMFIEPTNNVPPKSSGQKIEGSIVLDVAMGRTGIIPCDVSGYPVPKFR